MAVTLEAGLETWRADVEGLKYSLYPDAQVPLIALAGIVEVSDVSADTCFAVRQIITADTETCAALTTILPNDLAEELNDEEMFPIDLTRAERDSPYRTRITESMILDGLPKDETMISVQDYFLARFFGQAAFNFAVHLEPFRINMAIARHPLSVYFPGSLELIEAEL
jgi:hypothetical protein